ncbi:C40 family peptidase [Streptomyces sp. NBC_01304]|uniref:C40 family peptidase n=1 Tax=Streptomyces sp. NBC_01304 TaxID=2903818 RepID=UPI002E0D1DDB|nr:NlpC/P60 family protein [Streptomyces sp. NBC_01304]
MSVGRLSLACTATAAAVAISTLAAPPTARAVPGPGGERSITKLLTDLQTLYRKAEEATEAYNSAEGKLKTKETENKKLGDELGKARLALGASRALAGRMARQQYQGESQLSAYVQLLLARNPRTVLDQSHLIRRVAAERMRTLDRLAATEQKADDLATKARKSLDAQQVLAAKQKKQRDAVAKRLKAVEKLLAGLSMTQLAELRKLEEAGMADAQRKFMASGALSSVRAQAPSQAGDKALRYAVRQIGKPYEWGAEGPATYDCSGLTSQAWTRAGHEIPRTSQEQWATLPRIPLRDLRPGDLVIYFPKATHVAMYLGDGMVIQAPRPGARVKVSPIASNPLLGAVRPDPGGTAFTGYQPPRLPKGAMEGSDLGYGSATAPISPSGV